MRPQTSSPEINLGLQVGAATEPPRAPQPSMLPAAEVAAGGANTGPISPAWQRIWLRAQAREWNTLALMGSSKRSPHGTMHVASGLARVSAELGHSLVILDARAIDLRHMAAMQSRMRSLASRGTRAICVMRLPSENVISVPLAQVADAAILCVFLGETKVVTSSQCIEQIGRDRFLGTVLLRPTEKINFK